MVSTHLKTKQQNKTKNKQRQKQPPQYNGNIVESVTVALNSYNRSPYQVPECIVSFC